VRATSTISSERKRGIAERRWEVRMWYLSGPGHRLCHKAWVGMNRSSTIEYSYRCAIRSLGGKNKRWRCTCMVEAGQREGKGYTVSGK
jgi:hypothetical protein